MDRYLKSLVQITPAERERYSVDYAITITLRPVCYKDTYEIQYSKTAESLLNAFKFCRLTLIAELTQTYNIHYHGIISIPLRFGDPKKWFFDRLRPLTKIGKSECKQCENYELWTKYITKDIEKEYAIFPIVKDDYDLTRTNA